MVPVANFWPYDAFAGLRRGWIRLRHVFLLLFCDIVLGKPFGIESIPIRFLAVNFYFVLVYSVASGLQPLSKDRYTSLRSAPFIVPPVLKVERRIFTDTRRPNFAIVRFQRSAFESNHAILPGAPRAKGS